MGMTVLYTKNVDDTLLINVLEADTEVPVSNLIELAFDYYYTTGEYVSIGCVSTTPCNTKNKQKQIHLHKHGDALKMVLKRKEEGIGFKRQIRDIVLKSVTVSDHTSLISQHEYFCLMQDLHIKKEQLKTGAYRQETLVQHSLKTQERARNEKTVTTSFKSDKELNGENKTPQAKVESKTKEQPKKTIQSFDNYIVKF